MLPPSCGLLHSPRSTGGRIEVLHPEFHFENCDDDGEVSLLKLQDL